MRAAVCVLVLVLLSGVPLGGAHVFNHEDRHEICQVYGSPTSHAIGDGHAHTHDDAHAAGMHDHDPCKQVRMNYPGYENKAPLSEILPPTHELDPLQLLFSDGDATNTEVFIGGEAYQFPVPEGTFHAQSGLNVLSDLQAAGMGFPGSGTYDDPYIVEGYLITGNMVFKDTSKCFVIRNNVVVNRVAVAPLIPDPLNITKLVDLVPYWEDVKQQAEALRQQYLDNQVVWNNQKAVWDAEKAVRDQDKAGMDALMADYQAQASAWQAEFDQFEQDYIDAVLETQALADDFEWYARDYLGYLTVTQPSRDYAQYIDFGSRNVLDMDALQPAFEAYQEDLDDDVSNEDVEGWVLGNPPPPTPPPGFWGNQQDWDMEIQNYQSYRDWILGVIDDYWNPLIANEPDEAAYQQFVSDYAAFQVRYDAFYVDYNAFLANHNAFLVDYDAFQDEFDQVWTETGADIAAANNHFAKAAEYVSEYTGTLGTLLYDTAEELLDWVMEVLFDILDILDLNNVAQNTGQFILDWNGQCIHAYNNVVNDLRVNQNNDRTGWATGGILEDNRFFTIGQIRHYDGIFRENEVGNRAHLMSLLDPSVVPAAASARSINNDGANQGWYFDNVIYGQVDLDFHGHHHSAGFFAPISHYHGSSKDVAYMRANSACTATDASVNGAKANGPYKDYPSDNDIDVLGETVVERPDTNPNCLPHWDHGKRWTSVFFNDNVVIDPSGVGLRFEDRDHRADDEKANSENMLELKKPHFHQKWVQLEGNVVVGKIFVDILNAAGTSLWSDNWAAVTSSLGAARTAEALAHPGAEIVNSHPYRNDAWLDIQRNSVFQTQSTGILVSDAEDLTLFQLKDNHGFALPKDIAPGMTRTQFVDWLRASEGRTPNAVQADIQSWGGQDRGVQTLLTLANLRDAFTVQHCGNTARGLDKGLTATDRIYDDGASIILACGSSDWGAANPAVDIRYTAVAGTLPRCTDDLREETKDTDDFYASELVLDTADVVVPAGTCEGLPV